MGSTAGTDPRWTVLGPAGAPLVVFIHPTRMNRTFWTPQLEALSPSIRVLAVDLPGHGRLERERFTLAGAVAVVRAAIDSERASMDEAVPTVIVGLSLGGYVAMALAAEAPESPMPWCWQARPPNRPGGGHIRSGSSPSAYDRTHHLVFDRLIAAFVRRRYPGGLGDLLVASGFASRGGSDALRSLAGEPFLPRLAAYPGTVVLVNGGRERSDAARRATVPGHRPAWAARNAAGRLPPLEPGPAAEFATVDPRGSRRSTQARPPSPSVPPRLKPPVRSVDRPEGLVYAPPAVRRASH